MTQLSRFTTLRTIDGFDVVDASGHAVDHRSTLAEANGVAFHLNGVARENGVDGLEVAWHMSPRRRPGPVA